MWTNYVNIYCQKQNLYKLVCLLFVMFSACFLLQWDLKWYQILIGLLSAPLVWLTKCAAISTKIEWLWPRSIYVWKITENECNLITSPVLIFAYVNVIPCWETTDRELMWNVVVAHQQTAAFRHWALRRAVLSERQNKAPCSLVFSSGLAFVWVSPEIFHCAR